jgi:hypothetical protein
MKARALLVLVIVTCVPAVSRGQVLERPQRARPPRSESTSSRQVTLSATTLGSYDDNLTAEQAVVNPDVTALSGYTGYADGTLRFEQLRGSKVFDVSGRAYVNSFRNIGLGPMYGGDAQAHFGAGTRYRLDLWQGIRNEPLYNIGGFAAFRQAIDAVALPDENPLNGSSTQRSWSAASRVDFTSQWSPRNVLGVSVGYDTRDYSDLVGDTRAGAASLFYNRNIGRRSRLRFAYAYGDSRLLDPVGWIPLQTHAVDGGFELDHRFSPTRRLLVSFRGGAIGATTFDRFAQQTVNLWLPAGFGTMRLDWARTWGVSADYRRSVGSLQGISGDAFTTDAALVRVGGFVAEPVEVGFSVGYAEGRLSYGQASAYDTFTTSAQLRVHLSNAWSAVVSHDRYQYALRGIDPILRGLPEQVDRNAVRVGLAMNLPLGGRRERAVQRTRD